MAMSPYFENMHDGPLEVVAYTEKTGASYITILPFLCQIERPKNQVMRAIERLSKAYIWENFWDIFAPVYF